ncbi:hypothetical protein F4804DRAFT_351413 [Jackrogersella minutella]|nr:hypothetical protein F4804DRAFT_351413 [Jackrogersella minutella]
MTNEVTVPSAFRGQIAASHPSLRAPLWQDRVAVISLYGGIAHSHGVTNSIEALLKLGTLKAYRYFSSKDRTGKVVVSLENPNGLLTVVPSRCLTIFSREKVYLLVDALGGLGRGLAMDDPRMSILVVMLEASRDTVDRCQDRPSDILELVTIF